jgi:hypothetical protein
MAARSGVTLLLLASLAGVACGSHPDNVCQDVGDCSHGGSTDWIAACQGEAKALQGEAAATGCSSVFDGYFGCADSKYSCQGATALFPGCDQAQAALDTCLAAAPQNNCTLLAAAEAACGAPAPDGGTDGGTGRGTSGGTSLGLPPACTAGRDCQARCYLDQVANACAPAIEEIQMVSSCAATCPP